MKKQLFIIALLLSTTVAFAQTKQTKEEIKKDSIIKADIIDPAERDAQGEAPDWNALTADITKKYDATYADRTVTKAKIYFTYYKDWPTFTAAIVHYTEKYESFDNLKLLDTNANYILKNSDDKKELEAALAWSKHTLDKDPQNEAYKKTYAALQDKLATK